MILAFLIEAAQLDPAPLPYAWASFRRAGALSHVSESVEIATDGADRDHFEYKLRLVRRTIRTQEILWASSRTCPAVRPILRQMREIPMPRPAPFGLEDEAPEIILDGAFYELKAPSTFSNGQMTISSNVGSPLAKWVDGAFASLASCWSKVEARESK